MGGYVAKRIMFLQLLTPILLLPLLILSSSGEAVNSSENRVCVSKGGRSQQPYELDGKLPQSADPEFRDLNLCSMFHEKTCCSASRMLSASLALQDLATHGEASKDCLFWFELLECSICHPDVGVQPRPLRICASFCDTVFEACSDAYFSSDATNEVTVPCGARNGTICEKAYNLETNGTAFCEAVGFTVVQGAGDNAEDLCYASKSVLLTVVPVVKSLIKTVWFQDLKYRMVILNVQMCWLTSLMFLVSTLLNRREMERDARRWRRRNRNIRRF